MRASWIFCAIPILTVGEDKQRIIAVYDVYTFASGGLFYLCSDGLCHRNREIVRTEGVGRLQTSDGRGHVYERFINGHSFEIVRMAHQDGIKMKREGLVSI